MALGDNLKLAKLALALRRIWHGAKTITVDMVVNSIALIYEFLTGKKLK